MLFALAIAPALAGRWDFKTSAPVLDQPGHKEWTWDGGTSLFIGLPATVHYARSGSPRIVITGSEEALRHVRVGEGHIVTDDDWSWHWGSDDRLDVTVSGVALDHISLGGSGKLLLGRLDQDHLDIGIGGSGTVSAEGRVDHLKLSIGGSGKAELGKVVSAEAKVAIGGSGKVEIAPRDEASISVAGSGTVRLATRPALLHSSIAGSGQVLIADKDGGYTEEGERHHGMSRLDY